MGGFQLLQYQIRSDAFASCKGFFLLICNLKCAIQCRVKYKGNYMRTFKYRATKLLLPRNKQVFFSWERQRANYIIHPTLLQPNKLLFFLSFKLYKSLVNSQYNRRGRKGRTDTHISFCFVFKSVANVYNKVIYHFAALAMNFYYIKMFLV